MALTIDTMNKKAANKTLELLKSINSYEKEIKDNNLNIRKRIDTIRKAINSGKNIEDFKAEIFALVKIAAENTIGLSHFNTQMITADVILNGAFAEMKTGEGKTLAITPAAVYKALNKKGVHIFTSNDYLAKTNYEELKPLYESLGLSVGVITSGMSKEEKRKAYNSDIVYGSSEIIFDMLRDNTTIEKENLVFKKAGFAIVDEADDVFLDSARTPYVIAGNGDEELIDDLTSSYKKANLFVLEEIYKKGKKVVKHFANKEEFEIDNYHHNFDYGKDIYLCIMDDTKQVVLTEAGWLKAYSFYKRNSINKLANSLKEDIIDDNSFIEKEHYIINKNGSIKLTDEGLRKAINTFDEFKKHNNEFYKDMDSLGNQHYIENSLKAYYMIHEGIDYEIITDHDGKKKLSLVINGRTSQSRSYSEGLQQALELKEVSFAKLEGKKSDITLTLEHKDIASTSTVAFFKTMYDDYTGLTGTAPIESFYNLYGKDTVIIPKNGEFEGIDYEPRVDNSTVVYKEESEKIKAIIEDIRERHAKGQPILVGTTSVEESLLISKKLKEEGFTHRVLNARVTDLEKEGEIISKAGKPFSITVVTNMAGRGTDIKLGGTINSTKEDLLESVRKTLFRSWEKEGISYTEFEEKFKNTYLDNPKFIERLELESKKLLEKRKKEATNAGGLYVLGTSLNKVKRVDDQLRGRAGRQTDSGESRFYTSLSELRDLGLDREYRKRLEKEMGSKKSISGEYSDKLIEKVQAINESNLTLTIKNAGEFDTLIADLQEKTYNQRRRIVEGEEDLTRSVYFMIEKSVTDTIGYNIPEYKNVSGKTKVKSSKLDYNKISNDIENNFGIFLEPDYIKGRFTTLKDLAEYLVNKANSSYEEQIKGKSKEEVQKINRDIMLSTLDEAWDNFRETTKMKKDQHILDILGGNDKHDRVYELKKDYNNAIRQARVEVVQQLFGKDKKKLETIEDKNLKEYSIDSNDYDNSYSMEGKITNLNIFTRIKEKLKYIINKKGPNIKKEESNSKSAKSM